MHCPSDPSLLWKWQAAENRSSNKAKMIIKIIIAYIAKEELPFVKFKSIILIKKNCSNVNPMCSNDANCEQCMHGIPDQRRHGYRHKGMCHCVWSSLAGGEGLWICWLDTLKSCMSIPKVNNVKSCSLCQYAYRLLPTITLWRANSFIFENLNKWQLKCKLHYKHFIWKVNGIIFLNSFN